MGFNCLRESLVVRDFDKYPDRRDEATALIVRARVGFVDYSQRNLAIGAASSHSSPQEEIVVETPKIRTLTVDQHGDVAVLDVTSLEIDTPALARVLGTDLELLIQARPAEKMVLDFSNTKYMSSTAFAVLLGFGRRATAAGIAVRLCGFLSAVRFGADVLGIGRIIPIYDSRSEAISAFAEP